MIVVTGPGRSGTSLVARLYLELGFDPGGTWSDAVDAGLEDAEIVDTNEEIIHRLGMSHLGAPSGRRRAVTRIVGRLLPRSLRGSLKAGPVGRSSLMALEEPSLLRWDRLGDVVEDLGPRLREVAARHPVAKDPRFCWTLGVWAAAGADIEHVTVCVRPLEEMVRSRSRAQHLRYRSEGGARNGFVYATGLCMTAIHDRRIPHAVIRFPDFLDAPDELHAALRFPQPVSPERLAAVVRQVVRPELVHAGLRP